ncbi:TadE/TadG family type IV pilus assembly protein [Novosphingobium sp. BL-8A]|uniref:TadE/TadG family type IV pilus assembly protein n=1 Tax=Novosphingobium sp. BL-8A TaxID=3127639 RepID=UPI0037569F5E
MKKRSLCGDRRGATLIEFAIVAPVFILMLIGLIETGRFLWSQHVLKDVAFATVRCMSVSANCASSQTRTLLRCQSRVQPGPDGQVRECDDQREHRLQGAVQRKQGSDFDTVQLCYQGLPSGGSDDPFRGSLLPYASQRHLTDDVVEESRH